MPRIKFIEDFEYKPIPQQTYSYSKGDVVLVTQKIADKALNENKAELIEFKVPPSGINETIKKFDKPKKAVSKKEAEQILEDKEFIKD